jgi:hypothetical protein
MPVVCEKYKLAFFCVPKVASTSMKEAIYQLEYGAPFSPKETGARHIHRFYPTESFDPKVFRKYEGYWRFTILRDPFARIISAYHNRVLQDREMYNTWKSRWRTFRAGLNPRPSLDDFCKNLIAYRQHPGVRAHRNLIAEYTGPSVASYEAVYQIENMERLEQDIRERTGHDLILPHSKRSESLNNGFETLSDAAKAAILGYVQPEYDMLDGRYTPPKFDPK